MIRAAARILVSVFVANLLHRLGVDVVDVGHFVDVAFVAAILPRIEFRRALRWIRVTQYVRLLLVHVTLVEFAHQLVECGILVVAVGQRGRWQALGHLLVQTSPARRK